ncbi:aldehyde dehydrogenase family protein [Thermophilibacter immobilis]|uniref:aldehyde dehydrogenase family protein n=1 Tax=Thermophilibacter immobilis TaxID=2779519 RepID=UPI0038CDA5EA
MSSWNYPFMLSLSPLIGAIAAGNCVVVKLPAYAPAVVGVIEKLVKRCFEDERCAVVLGSHQENTELLEQKFNYIFFTGSVKIRRVVILGGCVGSITKDQVRMTWSFVLGPLANPNPKGERAATRWWRLWRSRWRRAHRGCRRTTPRSRSPRDGR